MRWTQAALSTRARSCGRRSRVVLTPRRWRQLATMLCIARGWWQQARLTREITKETVKTIARGMPGVSGVTVVTTLVCFFISHTRLRAQRAPGVPCALSVGVRFLQDSGGSRRGIAKVCPRLSWLFEILNRRACKHHLVVPAKAGTHNHSQELLRANCQTAPLKTTAAAYGSPLSRGRR